MSGDTIARPGGPNRPPGLFFMLMLGTIAASMSGKLGDLVAAKNDAGPYFRAIGPNAKAPSDLWTASKEAFAASQLMWAADLTPIQRAEWAAYAATVDRENRIGQPIRATGQTEFIRSNCVRLFAAGWLGLGSITEVLTAPGADSVLYPAQRPTLTWTSSTVLTVEWPAGETWPDHTGAALLIYLTPAYEQTRNSVKRGFQLTAAVQGNTGAPPTSPQTFTPAHPFFISRQFWKASVLWPDGRLSVPMVGFVDYNFTP